MSVENNIWYCVVHSSDGRRSGLAEISAEKCRNIGALKIAVMQANQNMFSGFDAIEIAVYAGEYQSSNAPLQENLPLTGIDLSNGVVVVIPDRSDNMYVTSTEQQVQRKKRSFSESENENSNSFPDKRMRSQFDGSFTSSSSAVVRNVSTSIDSTSSIHSLDVSSILLEGSIQLEEPNTSFVMDESYYAFMDSLLGANTDTSVTIQPQPLDIDFSLMDSIFMESTAVTVDTMQVLPSPPLVADKPDPLVSSNFDHEAVNPAIENEITSKNETLGNSTFRIGQFEVIYSSVTGNDTMAILPTGSGKTLCGIIPALIHPGITFVFVPLVSLIESQVAEMNRMQIRSVRCPLSGDEDKQHVMDEIRAENSTIKFVFCTPESYSKGQIMKTILSSLEKHKRIYQFIIDEAHCLS
jgi:hypothetical protein